MKVGKTKREIHVHRELLRSRSPYFKRVIPRPHGTAITKFSLPDVDADVFCRFLSWLYANCFTLSEDDEWMSLCKLWLLAQRFEVRYPTSFCDIPRYINETSIVDRGRKVPSLQNQVVEVLSCRLYKRDLGTLDLETLHYVYDNTGPESKLRMLFVHISMWYGNQDVFAQMIKDMPPVFHTDYATQQAERASKLAKEITIDPWDLTGFLLQEGTPAAAEDSIKLESGLSEKTTSEAGTSHAMEDGDKKRKRTKTD
jgi:hypothetical protein